MSETAREGSNFNFDDFISELNSKPASLDQKSSPIDKMYEGVSLLRECIKNSQFDTAEGVHRAYQELKQWCSISEFEGDDRLLKMLLFDYFQFCIARKEYDVAAFIRDINYGYKNRVRNWEESLGRVILFLNHSVRNKKITREDFDSLVSQMRASFDFEIPPDVVYDSFMDL